jgi:selenide,water dikinase
VKLPMAWPPWHRKLLTDPQTSGGLLVACAPQAVNAVMAIFLEHDFQHAAIIGELTTGDPAITVS